MKPRTLILTLSFLLVLISCSHPTDPAREVINSFAGCEYPVDLTLSLEKEDGCDRYSYQVKNGRLMIEGSSPLALCHGFYDYVKSQGKGICSWSGNRFDLPDRLEDIEKVTVTSPVKHHYYFNVVTYGYTMPYWDWERWSRELDWMALHGMDMPLALVANEAITSRVFERLGLTEEEISEYFVGPAHFPWMRMGNISGLDSPLPKEWHDGQVKLMHQILDKMHSLGMTPICPGFAGFVPQSIKRLYPDLELSETSWCDGKFHNWMVDPRNELFSKIGKMFIEEWEKEFGKCDYYLVDSFNEMEIPFPPKGDAARYELVADYGGKVYESIKSANPDATWVMQGWMFGYQRDIWDYETLAALLSRVPDDKMLLLDLAADYNRHLWHSEYNWDFYKGFDEKRWVYSVIPSMGGKTGMTGVLEFYANGRLDALNSPNRGRLEAMGFAPEGIENNEVIYELLTDAGWRSDEINLTEWLENYTICRYGSAPEAIRKYWSEITQGVYGTFTDHPRYVWQMRPGDEEKGTVNIDEHLFAAIGSFAEAADELGESPLYAADLEELTAQYLGARMEEKAIEAFGNIAAGKETAAEEAEFTQMALALDRVLASHPCLKLDNWIGYARRWGSTTELADYYEMNAKRLVTIWGPPVDDYSARIWSGLVRDYYLPRWQHWFESVRTGQEFDFASWESDWVCNVKGLSPVEPYRNPVAACVELIDNY